MCNVLHLLVRSMEDNGRYRKILRKVPEDSWKLWITNRSNTEVV